MEKLMNLRLGVSFKEKMENGIGVKINLIMSKQKYLWQINITILEQNQLIV